MDSFSDSKEKPYLASESWYLLSAGYMSAEAAQLSFRARHKQKNEHAKNEGQIAD